MLDNAISQLINMLIDKGPKEEIFKQCCIAGRDIAA